MLDEITQFKLTLRLYLHIFGAVAASFFGALQLSREEFITGTISLLGCLYFILVIYILVNKRKYLWEGRAFLFFIPVTILNIIHLHPEFGIFWAYVGVTSFFLVMNLKEASIGAVFFLVGVFYLAAMSFPEGVLYRIYGTLILVALFSFSFSYLIERFHIKLNNIATRDPLTNALNRYTFNTSIEKALHDFKRHQVSSTLILLDLDHFKKINDSFGHLAGDKILQITTRLFQNRIRECDQLFRYGGEEFALLLTQTDQQAGVQLAEELREVIQGHDFQIEHMVTISCGVSEAQKHDKVNNWLKRCDKALYQAKETGRNKVVTFE